MTSVKKIIIFAVALAVIFVIKELLELYSFLDNVHPWAGYLGLVLMLIFIFYFAIIPIYKIIKLPVIYGPATDEETGHKQIPNRIAAMPKALEKVWVTIRFG